MKESKRHVSVSWVSSVYVRVAEIFQQQHPLAWQPSQDGSRLIGRLLLKKGSTSDSIGSSSSSTSTASILGLKVIGGKLLEDGTRAAIIEKVKKGSIADIEGQLLPG